jgi:O-antigen ligase
MNFFHLMTHPHLWLIDENKSLTGYLLGNNYNQMGCRLLCAVAINILCFRLKKFWIINTIPLIIVSVATVAIVRSMTSLTLITLFLVFCFLPSKKLQRTGIISLLVFYVFFQIFVCFNGKGLENNELAVYFIEDVLKKDITFTNRTELWDAAAHAFMQSPIIGYGFVDSDWYFSHMSSAAMGPHNFIYSVLINGGIVLLLVFIVIFIQATKKAFTINDRNTNVLLAATAVLLFMMTMEVYPLSFILLLLSLVYYRPWIDDKPQISLELSTIQVS